MSYELFWPHADCQQHGCFVYNVLQMLVTLFVFTVNIVNRIETIVYNSNVVQ